MDSFCNLPSDLQKKFKDEKPGRRWYEGFLQRHPEISLRTFQNLTKSRSNVIAIKLNNLFHEVYNYLLETNNEEILKDPNRVFNSDFF